MEVLRNFEMVESVVLPFKIMEAEAYLELFKKFISISIFGNTNHGEPNIEYARENIIRMNTLTELNIDKFADALIDICNKFSDETGKKHEIFLNEKDVFQYIEPKVIEIISTEKIERGGYNGFIFNIEYEQFTLRWIFSDEDTINFR